MDLFDYERGSRLKKSDRAEGAYPLVTAGEHNQGVKEFISNENQRIFSNAVTIDMFCNSFVHIKEFCCDDNILVLRAKKPMDEHHLRFISVIIQKDKSKYSYDKQYRMNSLECHKIQLPVRENGEIDFDFMRDFIKNIEKTMAKSVNLYQN